jgi:hypothetical protein
VGYWQARPHPWFCRWMPSGFWRDRTAFVSALRLSARLLSIRRVTAAAPSFRFTWIHRNSIPVYLWAAHDPQTIVSVPESTRFACWNRVAKSAADQMSQYLLVFAPSTTLNGRRRPGSSSATFRSSRSRVPRQTDVAHAQAPGRGRQHRQPPQSPHSRREGTSARSWSSIQLP